MDLQMMIAIFLDEFINYPGDIVRGAFRSWYRHNKWRPTIADLRPDCETEFNRRKYLMRALRKTEIHG